MAVQFNDVTQIGDVFIVKANNPLMGVRAITGYTDTVLNETGTRLFDREFKYSVNGVTYTDWATLTDAALQAVFVGVTNIFDIQYRYTRAGTDATEILTFISIELQGEIEEVSNPQIFEDLYFNKYFNYNDATVICWSLNVLNKLYERGVVAKYMERGEDNVDPYADDDDFVALFGALTHFFAILVRYAREFRDFTENQSLLLEYLKQKNIFLDDNTSLSDLQDLLANLYMNFLERGTNEIKKPVGVDGRTLDGELLRLLVKDEFDEFIFALIEREYSIWNLNNNSPLYRGTKGAVNLIKAYEFTQDLVSLTNYPLLESSYITAYTDTDGAEDLEVIRILNVDSPAGTIVSGIGDAKAQSKLILIDPRISYEITFQVRQVVYGPYLYLKVDLYDKDEVLLTDSPISAVDGGLTSVAIDEEELNDNNEVGFNNYYFIRVILFKLSTDDDAANVPDIGFGEHLIINNANAKYLSVELGTSVTDAVGDDGTNELRIYDFKVRPMAENFGNAFVMIPNVITSWISNNSELTNQVVENNIKRYLIPYNTILKNQFVDELYIASGTPLQMTVVVTNETLLGANNGTITIFATGGVEPYLYSINDGTDYFGSNKFTNLTPDSYDIRLQDAGLVEVTDTVIIASGASDLAIQAFSTPASKFDIADGTITILGSGGTLPYGYSIDGVVFYAPNEFTGVAAGSYTAYLKDANLTEENVGIEVASVRNILVTLTAEDTDTDPIENMIVTVTRADGFLETLITDVNGTVSDYYESGTYNFNFQKGGGYVVFDTGYFGITADFTETYTILDTHTLIINVRNVTGGDILDEYIAAALSVPEGMLLPVLRKESGEDAPSITEALEGDYSFRISVPGGDYQLKRVNYTVTPSPAIQEANFTIARKTTIDIGVRSDAQTILYNASVQARYEYTPGVYSDWIYSEFTDFSGRVYDIPIVEGYTSTQVRVAKQPYVGVTTNFEYPDSGLFLVLLPI